MAEQEQPRRDGQASEAGGAQQPQGQPPVPPMAPPPAGAWPAPPPPDVFREFSAGGWSPPQRPMAGPPPGYPPQFPAGATPPGAPGAGFWGQAGAPPFGPGVPPGAPTPPRKPGADQPPAKTSPFLILALGGLALVVILVPLVLVLLSSHSPSTASNTPQATVTPGGSTPAPTPTTQGAVFTPAGTAPTSQDCMMRAGAPCYSPEQMQQAFSLNSLYRQGYNGKGQTIVILGAGNAPNIQNDLHQFDLAWGLPDPPRFNVIQPFGPPVPYTCTGGEDGLQLENTLDVEWTHAIAPGANIVLLIGSNTEQIYLPAPSNASKCGLYDLEQGVKYALDHQLGNIITISYGGSELGARTDTATDKANEQKEYDAAHAIFQRAASMGVTVMSSAGDTGATNGDDNVDPSKLWDKPNISWPASDPYVLAVGGTTLTLKDAAGDYENEVVWNDALGSTGGGLSAIYNEPNYQQSVPNQSMFQGKRGIPDVAFPAEDFDLYETADPGGINVAKWQHWDIIGGTSASSPCWAGIIAIADQMSTQAGGKSLGFIQPGLYSLQGKDMHDITQGDNSFVGVQGYPAGTGYDLSSGWGTPIADQLLPALIQAVQQVGNSP